MKFETLAQQYIQERATYKYSTLKNYASMLNAHILPRFAEKEVEEISASDVRLFQCDMAKNIGGSRVNLVIQLLKSIVADAPESKMSEIRTVKKVRQQKTKVEPFTEDELKKIFAHLDPHFVPLFKTLVLTGMRPNEAFALTWADVDFENKKINIDKGMVDGIVDSPKTEASERVIPLPDSLLPYLQGIRKDSGLVFVDKGGGEIVGSVSRLWKRTLAAAGVKYRRPYSLRHSFASNAIIKGVPVQYVSKLLGHSTSATTFKFYARWIESTDVEEKYRQLMG